MRSSLAHTEGSREDSYDDAFFHVWLLVWHWCGIYGRLVNRVSSSSETVSCYSVEICTSFGHYTLYPLYAIHYTLYTLYTIPFIHYTLYPLYTIYYTSFGHYALYPLYTIHYTSFGLGHHLDLGIVIIS